VFCLDCHGGFKQTRLTPNSSYAHNRFASDGGIYNSVETCIKEERQLNGGNGRINLQDIDGSIQNYTANSATAGSIELEQEQHQILKKKGEILL